MKIRKLSLIIMLCAGIFLLDCSFAVAKHHREHRSYAQVESDENISTDSQDIDATYADWMTQNREALKNLPINRVPILGSHDAGSCDVKRESSPCHGYLTHSGHHITRMPYGTDVTSARCQSASIMDQLRYGVRYFDLRIAWQDGAYWIEHMWMSTPLFGEGGVFTEIKDFLHKHPEEIIILNMQALYSETGEMTAEEAAAYFKTVNNEFGAVLAPAGDFVSVTLGSLWAGKGRLIVIGNVERTAEPFLWDVRKVDSRWMDKQNSDELCDELNSVVVSDWRDGNSADKLRVLQAMTTTKHKILKAKETNARIRERLKSDWKDAPINVVQVDDSVNSGLMPLLIDRLK